MEEKSKVKNQKVEADKPARQFLLLNFEFF